MSFFDGGKEMNQMNQQHGPRAPCYFNLIYPEGKEEENSAENYQSI